MHTGGVAVDRDGNLIIANQGRQPGTSRILAVAARSGTRYGQAMTAGHTYPVAGNGTPGFSGDGGPATRARVNGPEGVALDATGNLVIADTWNNRIRVVAARSGTCYGRAMTAGHIYTVAGGGTHGPGNGGPATSGQLAMPGGVAVDATGNLVIADTLDSRIRVVAADTGTHYRQAMTAGHIYTVAGTGRFGFSGDGGAATSATISYPQGASVDAAGNLLIADTFNDRIRVVAASTGTCYGQAMTAGDIYTVAGGGRHGTGDGGPATGARLYRPESVTVDASGNLVIATGTPDWVRVVAARDGKFYQQAMTAYDGYTVPGHDTHRVVAASTGTCYGQAMTAGHIYTVAGNGQFSFSANDGPAIEAALMASGDDAVTAAGSLAITSTDNAHIRMAAG